MPLAPGTRFGPYEVQAPLGAGGMGEVYKARDTRLDRTVAIKILPDALSSDPEFRERFEREARTISQLDHPNICALYDVGQEHGTAYLVMQHLEGETLAARLTRGAMPVGEALTVAIQICSALDRAHRAGIVHRDLKPGNIMLTRSGARLLDFGLAKATIGAGGSQSMLPTSPPNLTAQGTILGTFQYMAPEQVEGREADARSDLFALGAVLYEMVTGRPAFQGKTQASLIGSILRDDPTMAADVWPSVPPAIGRVIRTCLAKSPDDRCQTAHDVMLQLQWIAEGGSQLGVPAPTVAASPRRRERLAWMAAVVVLALAATAGAGLALRGPEPPRTVRFDVATPESVISVDAPRISPDGRYLAFNATDANGTTQIWVRPLNALTAQPLAGTEGATRPFWSPDSQFIGFMAQGALKKVGVSGGPAQKIADAPTGADGTWSPDGTILFDGRSTDPIQRVSAGGGIPVVAIAPDASRNETAVGWPEFLPDGRHFLYLSFGQKPEDSAYRIGSTESEQTEPLMPAQTQLAFAPPGYLLFVRDRTLVAQRFDPDRRVTTGDPVPLVERVGTGNVGLARFSVSANGTLAYRVGDAGRRLVWVDRSGKEGDMLGDPGEYGNPALSRDGTRLAFTLADVRAARRDIWIRDLVRGVNSRFTFGDDNETALWSPDGATIVFSTFRNGQWNLFEKAASGQGEERLLVETKEEKYATDWSRDGRFILFISRSVGGNWDTWAIERTTTGSTVNAGPNAPAQREPVRVLAGPFNEVSASFSPDGRFIAYTSDESGRNEIYVQSFPDASGKWQVSNAGGLDAAWRADGRELTYRALDQRLMGVEIDTAKGFQAGIPQPLFLSRTLQGNARNKYLAAADGKRFLFVSPLGRDALAPTTVVLNWHAELDR